MSTLDNATSNCYSFERHNFTVDGFDSYKDEKLVFFVNYFSFGLPWLKLSICLVGIATNALNVAVLTRPYLSSSINVQFVTLECVNLVLYATFFYEFAMFYNKDLVILFSEEISLISTVSLCLHQTCVCASNWLTVSVGVWRLLAIAFPFKAATYCNKYRSKIVASVILVLSVTLWSYYFFSFECLLYVYELTSEGSDLVREVVVRITGNWRNLEDQYYFKLHFPIMVLVSTAVPCTLLAILSIALILRLWMARRDREAIRNERVTSISKEVEANAAGERRVTLALTAMIIMYILTYLPDSIVSVMYWFYPQTYIQTLFICRLAWNRCGILFCNCFTICFYCVMSKRLRDTYVRFLSFPFERCLPSKTKGQFANSSIDSVANSIQTSRTSVL